VQKLNSESLENELAKVQKLNSNYTNYNYTNNNYKDKTSASTTTGGNTLFSIANQNSLASPVVVNDLGKLNNLIVENFGKQPTPLQIDDMRYMLEENSLELLTLAVKEAVNNGRPYFSYLQGILNNWKHDGLNTPELVKNRVKPRSRAG
ncbi:DnaD domain protein, partial [Streptococcus anginosus]|uniref:DnaD domain protein n=2 Tax=Streptococcus TaxID=1301 RepID=UPI0021F8DFA4